jgi:hypothetical protein
MSIETSDDRIDRFRKLAAEARTMAAQIEPGSARDTMLEVAEAWERLAHLEAIDLERKVAQT